MFLGKKYKTKKERLRIEKSGLPLSADGSLNHWEGDLFRFRVPFKQGFRDRSPQSFSGRPVLAILGPGRRSSTQTDPEPPPSGAIFGQLRYGSVAGQHLFGT